MDTPRATLLIGYGNPGRADDGLGPALARAIAGRAIDGVTVETPYHLQPEDAATVAVHDLVVFADADTAPGPDPFTVRAVVAAGGPAWTSHTLAPEALLALARDAFGVAPSAVLIGVRGVEFGAFRESLSPAARRNLAAAVAWLAPRLRDGGRDLCAARAAASIGG